MSSGQDHVVVIVPFSEPVQRLEQLRQKYPHATFTFKQLTAGKSPKDIKDTIDPELYKSATILVTLSALPQPPFSSSAPNLRLIHLTLAGLDHIASSPVYGPVFRSDKNTVAVTTSNGVHGPQIAEWLICSYLSLTRHFSTLFFPWQQQRRWGKGTDRLADALLNSTRSSAKQTVGILGYGSIGRQVARLAKAMGMEVLVYTHTPAHDRRDKRGYRVPGTGDADGTIPSRWFSGPSDPSNAPTSAARDSLHDFLRQGIDWLVISVPLTAHTRGFIGADELRILAGDNQQGSNAIVSNISRGEVLDQDALLVELHRYHENMQAQLDGPNASTESGNGGIMNVKGIRGAALDVTSPEPLPEGHPLWSAPNCIVTPHISGIIADYLDRALDVLDLNMEREASAVNGDGAGNGHAKGASLVNLVDWHKGY